MKKIILILPLLLFVIPYVYSAELSCGFQNVPSVVSNRTIINISYANAPPETTTNLSIFVFTSSPSPTTRNNSNSFVFNYTNNTATGSLTFSINGTFGNAIIEDASYTLNCICYNGTGQNNCNSTSSITLDRHKPLVGTGITYTNPVGDGNTITMSIDRQYMNKCFVRFGSETAERKSMTLSGSTCTFTVGKNNPPNYDYQAFLEADDGLNSTLSSVQYITIRAVKSDGGGLFGGATFEVPSSQTGSSIGAPSNPFNPQNKNIKIIIFLVIGFFILRGIKIIK